jgi:hypothetical protein
VLSSESVVAGLVAEQLYDNALVAAGLLDDARQVPGECRSYACPRVRAGLMLTGRGWAADATAAAVAANFAGVRGQ